MEFLEKADFTLINELTIKEHGGNFVPPFNFLNESSLDYLLEAVNAELFNEEIYPSVSDKAAVYMYHLITGHVFQDGNKRTGLEAALLFLKINGESLNEDLIRIEIEPEKTVPEKGENSNEILFHFTMEIASGKITLDVCRAWFEENLEGSTNLLAPQSFSE